MINVNKEYIAITHSFGKTQKYTFSNKLASKLHDAFITFGVDQGNIHRTANFDTIIMSSIAISRLEEIGENSTFTVTVDGRLDSKAQDMLAGLINDVFMPVILLEDF